MVKSGADGPSLTIVTPPATAPAETAVELCGAYRHAVDAKGRVAVPALLRRGLPEGSVVAPGPERRLVIWPPAEWRRELDSFRRTGESSEHQRRFERQLSALSLPFEVDAQGRMLITAAQRSWAGIAGSAVFVGLSRRVEVVAEQLWDAERLELDADEFTRLYDLVHRAEQPAPGAPQ